MDLANFRISIIELFSKDPDISPKEALLIILKIKSAVCMAKNGKDKNHNRRISRRVNL